MNWIPWRVWMACVTLSGGLVPAQTGSGEVSLSVGQAGPGEEVAVILPSGIACAGLKVRIGSRASPKMTCTTPSGSASGQVLTFTVPPDAARGPQVATFERSGARIVSAVEFEVLPPEVEYLVAPSPTFQGQEFNINTEILNKLRSAFTNNIGLPSFPGLSRTQLDELVKRVPVNLPPSRLVPGLPDLRPLNPGTLPQQLPPSPFPSLPTRPSGTLPRGLQLPPDLASRLSSLGISVQSPPATFSRSIKDFASQIVPTTAVAPQGATAVKRSTSGFPSLSDNYTNQICGKDLRILEKNALPSTLWKYVAQLEKGREEIAAVIAPDTLGKPPGVGTLSADPAAYPVEVAKNAEGWESIGRNSQEVKLSRGGGNVVVFVLDTLNDKNEDSAWNDVDKKGKPLPGHGKWIKMLIHELVPRAEVIPVQVCTDTDGCRIHRLIQGLCAAGAYSSANPDKRVIVNMSLSTPYRSRMLDYALEDAVRAGVAVVAAYGNVEPCTREGGTKEVAYGRADRCNAYPAGNTAATFVQPGLGLYSVGATTQNNRETAAYQRGEGIYENDDGQVKLKYSPRTVMTQPTISAPGRWWMADTGVVYQGTSYSTPIVVGGLALWAEKHPTCGTWPEIDRLAQQLYLPNLIKLECKGDMPAFEKK